MVPFTLKRFLKVASAPILAVAALAAGCEHGAESTGALPPQVVAATSPVVASQSQIREVAIDNFSFNPPTVTVAVGTTVTWVNHDDVPHTVTASDKGFNSKALDTDDRFSRVFTAPGTYSYFCMVHPHMTGQVIVK